MQDALFELAREEEEGMDVVGEAPFARRRHAVLFFAAGVTGSGRGGEGGGGAGLTGSGADRSVARLCVVISCMQERAGC